MSVQFQDRGGGVERVLPLVLVQVNGRTDALKPAPALVPAPPATR
jgi:hypothetical protein